MIKPSSPSAVRMSSPGPGSKSKVSLKDPTIYALPLPSRLTS